MSIEKPKRKYAKDKSKPFGIRLPMNTFNALETFVLENNTWRSVVINNALTEYLSLGEINIGDYKGGSL